ncbi:hypothetical protein Namu_2549 [Nakamurella multipartita DSM 44233]|uniref:Uncharacterized protein n=2 Tax=Nakamurella TaxID=53460 RepID=C8X7F4_NAKMY|nr:hypothetical protein Namu_2549 [Nakamurella multipartita DSM 44233]
MMPVRWLRRTAPPDEKPLLDANVEVVSTGHGTVELMVVASYRPPPPAADPAAGQRLAERMLRTLLLGMAATIRAAASDGSATTGRHSLPW